MTTLYIRHPAKASIDSAPAGSVPLCQFALAGDGGNLLQEGAVALSSLTDLVGSARRVVLLLAAADVTLLRVKMPPLSPARLRAALPNLVEEQILGDPADCVMVAGPANGADAMRSVAVVQRAWLEVLVKALLSQGARSLAVLPAQLCLPLQPGSVAAALHAEAVGLELTLRTAEDEGMGLSMSSQPLAALQTLRVFAGEAPVTLYIPGADIAVYRDLVATVPGITLEPDHWAHWISASKATRLDFVPAMGSAGGQARNWREWRWPLRLAVLAVAVNLIGLNIEWTRMRREAIDIRTSILQTFRSVYPNETPLYPAEQMRRNIASARLNSGEVAPDEFTALSAAFGEALGPLRSKQPIASVEFRDRALTVKLKPDTIDVADTTQVRNSLAVRNLQLTEPTPGTWQIRISPPGSAPAMRGPAPTPRGQS